MRFYRWGEIWQQKRVSLALGAFDAMHRGHIEVLKEANAVTHFKPLPAQFIDKNFEGLIRTAPQRLKIFESLGLKMVLSIDFLSDFSKIEGNTFLDEIDKTVSPIRILSGADFRLGYKRRWDAEKIGHWAAMHHIDYKAIAMLSSNDDFVSSTFLRSLIMDGEIELANDAMFRPYSLDLEPLTCCHFGCSKVYDLSLSEQVLPPDGLYRTDAGIVSIFDLELSIENNNFVKEIGFINAFKKRSKRRSSSKVWC